MERLDQELRAPRARVHRPVPRTAAAESGQRRRAARLADRAAAALPHRSDRRQRRWPADRVLRTDDGCGTPARQRLCRADLPDACRAGHAQTLVHAPADRHPARSAGRAARPGHRLAARPGRGHGAAYPGLGPAAHHRARRHRLAGAGGLPRHQRPPPPNPRPPPTPPPPPTTTPERRNELLWSNPRYPFFRAEPLDALDASFGPRGAQGVPLTPGRSIAVDRQSIPYGTPVWLASSGPQLQLHRMVLAQDTGSAILGAVRADFFTGWGPEAGAVAGRLKQSLRLWALWPR